MERLYVRNLSVADEKELQVRVNYFLKNYGNNTNYAHFKVLSR